MGNGHGAKKEIKRIWVSDDPVSGSYSFDDAIIARIDEAVELVRNGTVKAPETPKKNGKVPTSSS